ncbi:MAG: TIGR04150 pseudo-rSAM protein [Parabacteroides sp.]|nr:TIGR04150 pseudo-rSAM protein [Parabacteroides sp.]
MKEYWFAVYPHCFLWLKGEEGLVYNTENHAKVSFWNTGLLAQKAEELSVMENLYCIRLTEKELSDDRLNSWVQTMTAKECAMLVEDNSTNERPLSLPPILKVQDEADYYRWEHRQGIDGNVIENLHRMVFHINGSTYGNELYARQMLYPVATDTHLSTDSILRFARNARVSPFLTEISLVGNPFAYEGLDALIEALQDVCPVSVHCTWQDVVTVPEQVERLAQKVRLHIIMTHEATQEHLPAEADYTFAVTSEQDYGAALKWEDGHGSVPVGIIPVYTGNNLHFFEECLYTDQESIAEITMDKREVFIRQKLNIHDFGLLTVMPDGKVYANPNHPSVGHIGETPHAILYREITEGQSWLRIRDQKPCCDCIFQWLCPSPSHYENVIGKPNLCHVKS